MKSKILIGLNLLNKKPFYIDLKEIINPHILIIGASGSGKTTLIKYLLEQIVEKYSLKITVIDGQGDILTPNTSSVMLHETSNVGINPLKLSTDKIYGGIRKKISHFISAINKTSRKLGDRQTAVLRNLLLDLYQARGFFPDNPNTWKLETSGKWRRSYPNVHDLLRFTDSKITNKQFGLQRESVKYCEELEKLNKKKHKLIIEKKRIELDNSRNEIEKEIKEIDQEIKIVNNKIIESVKRGLEKANGSELKDLRKYDNTERLKSVYDILENLFSSGIFKDEEPHFDPELKIHRYDISPLNNDEQKLFAEFLAQELFIKAKETGVKDRVYEYLVIDELRKFTNAKDSKEDDSIRLIAREARKYGLGGIFASQQAEHIPEDVLKNTSVKIITGVDTYSINEVSRKLNIDKNILGNLKPHKTILVNVADKNLRSNFYYPIQLTNII